MHTDTTTDGQQALVMREPVRAADEHRRQASGMSADVLRAANKVLDNYVASVRRHANVPTDASYLS